MPSDVHPDGQPAGTTGSAIPTMGSPSMSDSGAVTEAAGILASAPSLRPAGLLIHAAFGKCMAFDISIANGGARTAGRDACASAVLRKPC